MAGRLFLVCGTVLVLMVEVARGEGAYQSTKDGKTLVWNSHPKPGDVATWSGARDREDYAHGFGELTWYTKEPGSDEPQLYARYWGRMVNGKLEGPVNVHSRRKTDYAIFIDGERVTSWRPGTAPTRANARWSAMVAERRPSVERQPEPEAPAAGPTEQRSASGIVEPTARREVGAQRAEESPRLEERPEEIEWPEDIYTERRHKIDIDESLRILAFPPRRLRFR